MDVARQVLRPAVLEALEAVEIAAHDTINLDNEDDFVLVSLGAAYRALGKEADSERVFTESFQFIRGSGSLQFSNTIPILLENGYKAEVLEFVQSWITLSEALGIEQRDSCLSEVYWAYKYAGAFQQSKSILLRMAPGGLRDMLAGQLAKAFAEQGNPSEGCSLEPSGGKDAYFWAFVAQGAAQGRFPGEAVSALQKAESLLPLSNKFDYQEALLQIACAYAASGKEDKAKATLALRSLQTNHATLAVMETTAHFLIRENRLREAWQLADAIGELGDDISPFASAIRIRLLCDIAIGFGKSGGIGYAVTLIGMLHNQVLSKNRDHYTLSYLAVAAIAIGDLHDAVLFHSDLYKAHIGKGNPRDWTIVVAQAITAQAKAGLAYKGSLANEEPILHN